MIQKTVFSSLVILVACSTEKAQNDDTQAVPSIVFELRFSDTFSGVLLAGAEVCVLEPEVGENNCHTTDENGEFVWTWENPVETNFVYRLTLKDYFTTLYLGRYNDELGDLWAETFAETGVVELENLAFSNTIVDLSLQLAGTSHQEGMGHALFALESQDESLMEGAVIGLSNAAGDSVGEVLYANAAATGFDSALTSTSSTGAVTIANVAPGTYILTVISPDFSCTPGKAWLSETANTTEVIVAADSMTMGSMLCTGL